MSAIARTIPLLMLGGCSAVERISGTANDIRGEADALSDHGKAIGDPVVVERAGRIEALAATIHDDLSGVQDKVSQWAVTFWWVAAAVVAVCIVVILWQTGLGTAVRVAIGWIPRRVANDAELAAGMLDPENKEDVREYVAARRASSAEFDLAWRRLKKGKSNGDSR